MKTTFIAAVAAISLALATGCSTSHESQGGTGQQGTQVAVLFNNPQQSFTNLGSVSTLKSQPGRADSWQTSLRRQASTMGADAIVVDTSTLNNPSSALVTGTAIKYNNTGTNTDQSNPK